jgi:hypothetical protein
MQESFLEKLESLRANAIEYIRKVLKQRGTGYELIDPATYEEDFDDEVYDLPRANYVGKHGNYDEYPIVVIDIDADDILTFKGICKLGDTDDDRDFSVEELSSACLCQIADVVANLEK